MMLSDQSIIVARERYADLLREAERQRRVAVPQQPRGRQLSFVDRGRLWWSQGMRHVRAVAGKRSAPLAGCAD